MIINLKLFIQSNKLNKTFLNIFNLNLKILLFTWIKMILSKDNKEKHNYKEINKLII